MTKIKELLSKLDNIENNKYLNTIQNNNDILIKECHQFKIIEKTDLEDNFYYLIFDKNLNYCYFNYSVLKKLNFEILFNQFGEIILFNSHCNMLNKKTFKTISCETGKRKTVILNLDSFTEAILSNFTPNSKKTEVMYSKEKICYHFETKNEKYPIPLCFCHQITRESWNKITKKENFTRKSFNNQKQKCHGYNCSYFGKLTESHLISGFNIRNLNKNQNDSYYGSRFFDDLKDKPISFINSISDVKRESKNRNFKIACFCDKCDKSFINTDQNNFSEIKELTNEIIIKSFNIYLQEIRFNIKTYETLISLKNKEIIEFATNHFNLPKIKNDKKIILEKNDLHKSDKLIKYEQSSSVKLKKGPFIESVCLHIYKEFYYLIYITNKGNRCFFNFITDNPYYEKNVLTHENLIYAVISFNKYIIYSDCFYSEIKDLSKSVLFDHFNNNSVSHPILIPNINCQQEIKKIINNYIDQ